MDIKIPALLLLCGALGGCVNLNDPLSASQDVATRNNFAAQVADPTPKEGAPEMDASLAAAAIARHRAGKVKGGEAAAEGETFNLQLAPTN